MAGIGVEQLFEQPDLSIDIKDNGRVNISLVSLNENSKELVDEIAVYLKSLPPFQHEDGKASISLRILKGIPYWAREKKGESEGLLNGSKKIYGLFCIAKCNDIDDLTNVSSVYTEQLCHLSNPLMATRCLVFGSGASLASELRGKSGFTLIDTSQGTTGEGEEGQEGDTTRAKVLDVIKHCVTIVYSNITTLLGDRRSQKKAGSLPHSADVTLDDDETKRQHSRSCKALGDYHLLLGKYNKALDFYREGLATLEKLSKKEHVWLGAIFESLLTTNMLRKDSSILSNQIKFEISLAVGEEISTTPTDVSHDKSHPLSSVDKENVGDNTVSGEGTDFDGSIVDFGDSKIDKGFLDALQHYNRAGMMGKKPLFEMYLKYVGYLVEQQNYTAACKQLNEAQIVLSSEEQLFSPLLLSLYLTLSKLYHSMGLKRKTLFMMFNAGRQAVKMSITNVQTHYGNMNQKAYTILTHSLRELGIISDREGSAGYTPVDIKGWPLLQAMVLLEYVHLCWRMNYYNTVIRWAWLCIQTFHSHLPENEIRTLIDNVTVSSDKYQEETGCSSVQAPFRVLSVPHISQLKPQSLAPSLSVKQSKSLFSSELGSAEKQGPFIYHAPKGKKTKDEVLWVQGDPAEVLLVLSNPLPVEMKVEKMAVVLEGADVTTYPSTIALPALCSEPQQLVLLCIPLEPGGLSLTGYSANVFGLLNKSNVATETTIKVIPSLPQLRVKVLPKQDKPLANSSTSYPGLNTDTLKRKSLSDLTFELMDGEAYEYTLQLQSIGDVPVNNIKISVTEKDSKYCVVKWDKDELQSYVPMAVKNKTMSLSVKIFVRLPSSEIIGPGRIDESHIHRSVMRRHQQPKRQQVEMPKSMTLGIPNRCSLENDVRADSRTPSPLNSPRRSGKFAGSFRRSKKPENDVTTKKPTTPNVLESLDLDLKIKTGATEGIVKGSQTMVAESKNKFLHLKDMPSVSSVKSSRKTIKQKFAKFPYFASGSSIVPENTNLGGDTTPTLPIKPKSPPIPIPDDRRLMDSLNLEFPLASDLKGSSNKSGKSRDSALSDSTTDTTSDTVDFDSLSGDRVSITSDPGVVLNMQGRGSTSPLFVKSATMSTSSKEKKQLTASRNNSIKRSGKQSSSLRKKPLTIQQSLPPGSMPASKPLVSGLLQHASKLAPLFTPKGVPLDNVPQKRSVSLSFLLQYTGGEGAKEGYYREVTEDLSVTIQPALYLFDFSVVPVKGSADKFSFLFQMANVSPYNLEITIDVKQDNPATSHQWVLDSNVSREISFPMKRFTLKDHEATLNEKNILKPYCDHLATLLDVKWFSPKQNKAGKIELTGLELPHSVVASIRPLPVIFNYKTEAILYSPGVSVTVNIDITNNTDDTLPPCAISLKPYTISTDGSKIDCVKANTIIHSQSLTQWLPEIPIDVTHKLMLYMIFLHHDEYIIDVILHKKKEKGEDNENPSKKDASLPLTESVQEFTRRPSIIEGSAVCPHSETKSNNKSQHRVTSMKYGKLGNVNEFILQSKAYAGPQLTIKI